METNNTRQAAWVAMGSLCSFGFTIVSAAILSRYFNKADYGTYKQVMYVYSTLLMVFTLGLPRATSFFLPRVKLSEARSLISKITGLFVALGLVFSLVLLLFAPQLAAMLKNPDLTRALRCFAVVPLLLLPTMGLDGILATFRKTRFIAVYNIATNLFKLVCVAVPVMLWDLGYIEAICGFVVASFITFLLALYLQYLPVKGQPREQCPVTVRDIFRFSLPLLTASLWGLVISSADQFFISRYFGNEVFADFSNGSLELPFVGMVTGACATVLSPVFSRMSHEHVDPRKEIYPLWMSVFEKTAKLIYPVVIYCLVFADVVMVALYGQKYETSGYYFRVKLITNFFTLIAYGPLIINIGRVRFYSNVHMAAAFLVVALEFLSVKTMASPYAISWISMLCHVGRIFAMLLLVSQFFGVRLSALFPLKLMAKILIPSAVILLAEKFVLTQCFDWNIWVVLFVSASVYGVLFLAYCILFKIDYIGIIKPLLSRQ